MGVFAVAAMLAVADPGAAQAPVAIVEELEGKPLGVELMDYVRAGQVIRLAPGESIVLGFLKSCWRESIAGGSIIVGAEQSEVREGKVERVKVACDGGKIQLTRQQAGKAGGMVFRDARPTARKAAPDAERLTLHGLSPVVELRGGGTLVIERIDQPGERHVIKISPEQLVRAAFYDFARYDRKLAAGGLYRARAGARQIEFKIDPAATAGATPVVGRLLPFQPAR
jgi:hypothetical protein